jgi:hypothetical protein
MHLDLAVLQYRYFFVQNLALLRFAAALFLRKVVIVYLCL